MYFPARFGEVEAEKRATALGLRAWRDPDGRLLGWRPLRSEARTRVLVFHGNAGSALDRVYYLEAMGGTECEIVLFEYPGYGARPGRPSQRTLVEAAVAALTLLRSERRGPVWLLGESLGSGVAAQVAGRDPHAPAGLILVTPIARMTEVAAWHYPYLPVRALLRDRWDSVAALREFRGPTAILVAGRDEVVGAEQGRRLARAMPTPPRLWEQPDADHNGVDVSPGALPWPEIRALVDAAAQAGAGPEPLSPPAR
jgi:pimeloyl-ACP methyl ester carboxylesterase